MNVAKNEINYMQATRAVSLCYTHVLDLGEVTLPLAAQAASWQPSQPL